MRVALIHYWLVGMRGGEKVLEALCELFPEADIFTHVYDESAMSPIIRKHRVKTSFIQSLPWAKKYYKKYLPLMPHALEALDLRAYDLVISSEAGPAKGIITRPDALHICYCHSPMRYIWDQYHVYRKSSGFLTRAFMSLIAPYLRLWDTSSASRVDSFVANSRFVAGRIRKYYKRDAAVINPPVAVQDFAIQGEQGDYYLCFGMLVRYKRFDIAIEAFNLNGQKLIVAGTGEESASLKRMAHPNIEFVGWQSDEQIRSLLARCKALIFPTEEDFGIVPVETMACGRPVIAYKAGGALETIVDGKTGILFEPQTAESLQQAVTLFEANEHNFNPQSIRAHAMTFEREIFKTRFREHVETALANFPAAALMHAPIYINGRFLSKKITGTERFAREIVWSLDALLTERGGMQEVKIVAPAGTSAPEGLSHIGFGTCGAHQGHIWEQWDLPRATRNGFLLNLCNSGPVFHSRQLTIIHDAIVYRMPENYSFAYGTLHRTLGRLLARRGHIGTVSEFSRGELSRVLHIPEPKIPVFYNGHEHMLHASAEPDILDRLSLRDRRFFLFVGSPAPNKNLTRAAKAFALLGRPDASFVIVGASKANVFKGERLEIPANVLMPGRLTDGEIVALYRHATAMVFASLYEGFGIPPLEAMTLGCPLLASGIPAVQEVCADAALYFNPLAPEDMAYKMRQILGSEELRRRLVQAGSARYKHFLWKSSAARLLDWINPLLP